MRKILIVKENVDIIEDYKKNKRRPEKVTITCEACKSRSNSHQPRGFSIIELLVVISIVSLLTAVTIPVMSKVRSSARAFLGMNNQKQTSFAVNLYAEDNGEWYPDTVATIGVGESRWNWTDPRRLAGNESRTPSYFRSMSSYLKDYIDDADTMYCTNAPRKYKYLQQAWDAEDHWDNPDTGDGNDPVTGTYCFYWNYTALLDNGRIFKGPKTLTSRKDESKLLMSCYFGYDNWRSRGEYGSCERLTKKRVVPERWLQPTYWACSDLSGVGNIRPLATFTDGHVERFSSSQTITVNVLNRRTGNSPMYGHGNFYLPKSAKQ